MKRPRIPPLVPALALACSLLPVLPLPAAAAASPKPLVQAHAHNDYDHTRPLLDALDQGFCSVEADIYLVDGQLLVAHDRDKVKPERTLQALYLDPIRSRVRANGGRLFAGGPPATLLIDLKTEGASTYARLREVLASYREMLSVFHEDRVVTNAITVILSGNRPFEMMAEEKERLAGLDGRMSDLERTPPYSTSLVPLVSDNWRSHFKWDGLGEIPADERARLAAFVARAHAQGRRIRFWGAADRIGMWKAQHESGVDMINTDRLADLAKYFEGLGR